MFLFKFFLRAKSNNIFSFLFLCNSYFIFASRPSSWQLFFPVVIDAQFKSDDGLLDELRVSAEQTQGKARDIYLEAQVAAIYENMSKAERLSIEAYEQYLLSKKNGSSIKKQGTVAYVLWQLLSSSRLNKETTVLVQQMLEQETISDQALGNFSDLSSRLTKLQKVVQNCECLSWDHSSVQFLARLKSIVRQNEERVQKIKNEFAEKKDELKVLCEAEKYEIFLEQHQEKIPMVGVFCDKKLNLEHGLLLKKQLLDLKRMKKFESLFVYFNEKETTDLLKFHLVSKNMYRSFSDKDIERRTSVILKKLDNQELFSRIAQRIKVKENCSLVPSTRTFVGIGTLDITELSSVDSQVIEPSYLNEYLSSIIVLVGHSSSGDLLEIVKLPEENKVFYKIEIISRRVRVVSSSRTSSVVIPDRTSSVFIPSRLSAFKRVVPELQTAQRVVLELPKFSKIKFDLMPEDDLEQSKRT